MAQVKPLMAVNDASNLLQLPFFLKLEKKVDFKTTQNAVKKEVDKKHLVEKQLWFHPCYSPGYQE